MLDIPTSKDDLGSTLLTENELSRAPYCLKFHRVLTIPAIFLSARASEESINPLVPELFCH